MKDLCQNLIKRTTLAKDDIEHLSKARQTCV